MGKLEEKGQAGVRGWNPSLPVLALMVLFVIHQNHPSWAGFWLGLAVCIVNFHGLAVAVRKAVWLQKEQAQRYMTRNYLVRYGLRFIILAIALVSYDLNPITLLIGLTLPTVVVVVRYLVKKR